ncbi:alpha-L-fucosidase [Cohnella rhizosphaerae]|uniref:alpha-L-fucosidase n=1 Tax=Cohnella rhizosphaerae TaxID=1457232 RepID=A0A9X4KWC9_9BACL|nr:alpha-L-fucosidase [Cohnella rhizosphaerae]MDG0809227.1 alpha-L-fucosidase [Cohnella rhizosphaerae]
MSLWEQLDDRPVPAWFDDAKFGIFIHWGPYSVPSWAPRRESVNVSGEAYAEWYGSAMRQEGSPYRDFHLRTYGARTTYEDFAPRFRAELFEPQRWAELFRRSGARYVVLTAKHHDAFCLWPSRYAWNWNSADIGAGRDLFGELAAAVRGQGLRMGAYYSLLEWFNPLYLSDPEAYATERMIPQMKELIDAYRPSVLFTDGEWEHASEKWHSEEFLHWLFAHPDVGGEIVVNDRWGSETRGRHGGIFTTEYGEVGFGPDGQELHMSRERKWEENRGIGASFGYNRHETLDAYMTEKDVIHLLVDTVSRGGNLLLNVGPTADGLIPVIMEERLAQLGDWLQVNGEAIYGTGCWKARSDADEDVRYTVRGETVYAIFLRWPASETTLTAPGLSGKTRARMLGLDEPLTCGQTVEGLSVEVPVLPPERLPCRHAYVIRFD